MRTKRMVTLVLALAISCMLVLTACGGNGAGSTNSGAGKYELSKVTMQGMTIDAQDYISQAGGAHFELNADGTATGLFGGTELTGGSYSLNGDTMTITFDGEPLEFAYADGTLTLEEPTTGMVMEFAKQ